MWNEGEWRPCIHCSEGSLFIRTGWFFKTVWQNMCLWSINWGQNLKKRHLKNKMDILSRPAAAVSVFALYGLFSLCISSRYAPFRFWSQSRLAQNHHVIFGRVERLVDPVHAAGHVTGVAGDQHQVADGEQESSGPEEEEEDKSIFSFGCCWMKTLLSKIKQKQA